MKPELDKLNFSTKLAYGVGELARAIPSNILAFFLLFFLTDAVGLNPGWAGRVILVGKIWDAINDPIIGWLSDRTRSPWGRRYPWMIYGALPFGLFFFLEWVMIPEDNQLLLFCYYSAIILLIYTAYTAVILPFSTLAAELTSEYNERTQLISFQSFFGIGSSIFSLLLAQVIFSQVAQISHRYLLLGGISAVIMVLAIYICVWGTKRRYMVMERERSQVQRPPGLPIFQQVQIALSNKPFLYLIGIYLFSWLSLQLTAAIIPYFVTKWMGLSLEQFNLMALVFQGTGLLMMFGWSLLAQRVGKQAVYSLGVPLTMIALGGLLFLQPGQVNLMYIWGAIAGFGAATVYLIPNSMLPDVIDLDELNTGQRREGIFYGFVVQIQKIAVAFSVFMVGQILDWTGYIPVAEGLSTLQPPSALWAIRIITGLVPSLLLGVGLILVSFYPITPSRHAEIMLQLQERRSENL